MSDELIKYEIEIGFKLYVSSRKLPLWAGKEFINTIEHSVNQFNNETLTNHRLELDAVTSSCEKYLKPEEADDYKPYDEK